MFKLVKDGRELCRVTSYSEVANKVGSKILYIIEFWSQGVDAFVVHVSPNMRPGFVRPMDVRISLDIVSVSYIV
jgi:hypothetical protein